MKQSFRRAFTLIEVVVAIAIFSVTASILLASISNAYTAQSSLMKRDTRHEDRCEILRVAFSEAESDCEQLQVGGDYKTTRGEHVHWSTEAEETSQAGLFRVYFFIDWEKDSESETLVFYAFRPAWKSQFDNQEILLEDLREHFPSDRFDTY